MEIYTWVYETLCLGEGGWGGGGRGVDLHGILHRICSDSAGHESKHIIKKVGVFDSIFYSYNIVIPHK